MLLLSPQNLTGEVRTRWEKSRKELLRSVLRDPGASAQAKSLARRKLENLPLPEQQFVAYSAESVVEPTNGAR